MDESIILFIKHSRRLRLLVDKMRGCRNINKPLWCAAYSKYVSVFDNGKTSAFITLKDNKDNFETNPKCRLINPSKSELGKVSKTILDNINNLLREVLHVNQWKNSSSVIKWFNSIDNKQNHTFISFDIVTFYPSITDKLLDNVTLWAKSLTYIADEHITIIKHAHKSLLFYREKTWIKKNHDSLFDVTMGSYDGAEICELVGLFLVNNLAKRFGKESVGLYRDDGLLILKGTGGRQADQARKDLHRMFNEFDLKVTAQINNHQVNFLDVTFNLNEENYHPHRKPNNDPLYIDSRSNHPPNIIKQLPKSINDRLSALSSNEKPFKASAPLYDNALSCINYNIKLEYSDKQKRSAQNSNPKRKRNIIWFNPPYSKNVRTNVTYKFLALIDKHFPKSSVLHKIFNRNSVKVSYSCMPNAKSNISNHDRRVLNNKMTSINEKTCNCRAESKCPLEGKFLTTSIVCKAEITPTDTQETKEYTGITAGPFKERHNNLKKSLTHAKYAKETYQSTPGT